METNSRVVPFLLAMVLAACPASSVAENQPPEVMLEAIGPAEGTAPFYPEVQFGCSDPEDDTVLCEFKSDGSTVYLRNVPPYPAPETVDWPVYNTTGTHTIEVIATDSEGRQTRKALTFLVYNAPPNASIASDRTAGRAPFYPFFTYGCEDPEDRLYSCEIKSDGERLIYWGPYPENTVWPEDRVVEPYREPGAHTLEIIAVDEEGGNSSQTLTFTVASTIDVYVEEFPADVDSNYRSALREAFGYWEQIHGIAFREVGVPTADSVYVDWAKEYQTEAIGRAEVGGSRTIIGLGDSQCYGKFRVFSYDSVAQIATHELGHILGYLHSNDTSDIMYPVAITQYETDLDETAYIAEGWYYPYSPCTRQETATYAFAVTSDRPVDVYAVPSEEEYNHAAEGRRFQYYSACYAEGVRSFRKTCTIPQEAVLFVHHPDQGGRTVATVHIQMQEK